TSKKCVHAEVAIKVLSVIDLSYHSFDEIKTPHSPQLNDRTEYDPRYKERLSIAIPFIGTSVMSSQQQQNPTFHSKLKDDGSVVKGERMKQLVSNSWIEPVFSSAAANWINTDKALLSFENINLRVIGNPMSFARSTGLGIKDFLSVPDKSYNIKDKVDEVEKPYEWAHDEWYYEEEIEDYKYWKAEEEKAANKQRLLELAKNHKKQLASMSRLNSFDDQSYDDLFQSDKENFEALDYEDAHLGMSFERSPKIALLDS
ncbi:hypothetical protein Tco_0307806, partial [Tanacetum coccineum]